jgi:hypothetical protein
MDGFCLGVFEVIGTAQRITENRSCGNPGGSANRWGPVARTGVFAG